MEEKGITDEDLRINAKVTIEVLANIDQGYNIGLNAIKAICRYLNRPVEDVFDWNPKEEPLLPKETKERRRSEIYQCDKKTGKIINRFSSAREAGRILGKEFSAIVKVANGDPKRKTAYGFRWVWVEDYKEEFA